MSSLNQCNFIGNLGRDPEVKYTASGQAVANFSLAVSESYKDKGGERVERTEWVNVVAWGKLAEICGEFLSKGKTVFISGRQQTRKWEDKNGVDRYTVEIVADKMLMLGSKGESKPKESPQESYQEPPFDDSDEIPF